MSELEKTLNVLFAVTTERDNLKNENAELREKCKRYDDFLDWMDTCWPDILGQYNPEEE